MRSSILFGVLLGCAAFSAQPGDKRTILTSGEKVHKVGFALGQSTIIYLGFKPETVICGNKNYFNIEKIKEGVTIQPLANFATNLSIMDKDKRFLFYLVPSSGSAVDSFVDVKWVPESEQLSVEKLTGKSSPMNVFLKVTNSLELMFIRKLVVGKKQVLEIELRNDGKDTVKTKDLGIFLSQEKVALKGQSVIWETNEVKKGKKLLGRILYPVTQKKSFDLVVSYKNVNLKSRVELPR